MQQHQSERRQQPVDRRTIVRGVAWTAPAVALCATAPALAASPVPGDPELNDFTWPLTINYAGWEWGNPSSDILARGLMARTAAGGVTLQPGELKIVLNIHDDIKYGALCPNTNMIVKPGGMTFVDGLNGWGGDLNWTFQDISTGSGETRDAKWEFTYQGTLLPGQSVRLSFNADVDVDNFFCALRITQTPNMTYSVSAPGYPVKTQMLWHNNDVV